MKTIEQERRRTLDDIRNLINSLDTQGLTGSEVRKLIYRSLDLCEPRTDFVHQISIDCKADY